MSHNVSLPGWLVEDSCYEPPRDRDSYVRRNVLALASSLARLRSQGASSGNASPIDSALSRVSPAMRFVVALVLVGCTSMARNGAFVWLMAAVLLVTIALKPARSIKAVLVPALLAALVAGVVNLPALLLGQSSSPVRMASKSFVTVGVVANLAQSIGAQGMVEACSRLGLPSFVVTVVDFAIRDIIYLGEAATSLSEALCLRSVGRNRYKASSAGGVLGVVFVRAQRLARERAEAMELRGYGGTWKREGSSAKLSLASVAYLLCAVGVVALFSYLEAALP